MLTEIGPVEIEVPRDRDGSFDPQIVRKRQRRLGGVDEIVLSLTARGLTTGEVSAHFAEVYGAKVSKDTISRITEKVVEEMTEWRNRPLDRVTGCSAGCAPRATVTRTTAAPGSSASTWRAVKREQLVELGPQCGDVD